MSKEEVSLLAAMGLFALGAVALILYQHAASTNTVIAALGGGVSGNVSLGGSVGGGLGLGAPASLAGTPIIGQDGSSATPAVMPLNINPGYYLQ